MTLLMFVVFTIVREHGSRFLSSSMSLLRMRRPWQVPALCLRCARSIVGVEFCYSTISLGSPSSLRFLGLGSPPFWEFSILLRLSS